jgi:hypothetical protein
MRRMKPQLRCQTESPESGVVSPVAPSCLGVLASPQTVIIEIRLKIYAKTCNSTRFLFFYSFLTLFFGGGAGMVLEF